MKIIVYNIFPSVCEECLASHETNASELLFILVFTSFLYWHHFEVNVAPLKFWVRVYAPNTACRQ